MLSYLGNYIFKKEVIKIKVPAYIITGFLGSGKTTVLQTILEHCKVNNLKPAIVLNEIGETNVEADLFKEEAMLEMLNGCICCSIQEDFTKELRSFLSQLTKEQFPDFLLIEGTGVANPIEIVDALTDPSLIELVELHSVINLIDTSKFLEYQSIFSSSKEVRTLLKSQITTSTLIVLNKIDLVDDKTKIKVRKKISEFTNETPMIEANFGKVEMSILLEKRTHILKVAANTEKQSTCGCSSTHTCSSHSHNHTFVALQIQADKPLDRILFEKWLKDLPKTMVRGKGIIQLQETVGFFQFQYSSDQLRLERINGKPTTPPCVILIGTDLDVNKITSSFNKI